MSMIDITEYMAIDLSTPSDLSSLYPKHQH